MPRIQILITINTDPVPGEWDSADKLVKIIQQEVATLPTSCSARVGLVHPDVDENCVTVSHLIDKIGGAGYERFMMWGPTRYFYHPDTNEVCFWTSDYHEWMNTREG